MTERRQQTRRRTYLAGRVEVDKLNGWGLDCVVRNVSADGARLAIPAEIVVPRNVSLAISNGARRPAELIWYCGGQAGFALSERRGAPRPLPATEAGSTTAGATRLSARIAAIAAGSRAGRTHFTGI